MFPFLVEAGDSVPRPWQHGDHFTQRMAAKFIRVTPKGVQHCNKANLREDLFHHSAWNALNCTPVHGAFCIVPEGDMRVFPTSVVDMPVNFGNISPLNGYLSNFPDGSACTSRNTGRAINASDVNYEISLCDLLDSNLDIVLDHASNQMFWRKDLRTSTFYVVVSITALIFLSCITSIIIDMTKGRHSHVSWPHSVVLISLILFAWHEKLEPVYIVTREEVTILKILWSVSLWECALQIFSMYMEKRDSLSCKFKVLKYFLKQVQYRNHSDIVGIALFTKCLLLITIAIHYTVDTPYLTVLTVIWGSRTFFKNLEYYIQPVEFSETKMFFLWLVSGIYCFVENVVFFFVLGNLAKISSSSDVSAAITVFTIIVFSLLFSHATVYFKTNVKILTRLDPSS